MSLLNYNMDDIPDQHTMPPGEHQLELKKVEQKTSKKGDPMLESLFTVVGDADAKPIFHYTMLPAESDDDNQTNNKLRRLKEFLQALGADISGDVETETLVGSTCFAILKEEDDAEYGKRNSISRFFPQK